jgi:hypothetical protein
MAKRAAARNTKRKVNFAVVVPRNRMKDIFK